ncbi:MAG: type IV pilus secretin PilQ [Pseudomonadota bacterium]
MNLRRQVNSRVRVGLAVLAGLCLCLAACATATKVSEPPAPAAKSSVAPARAVTDVSTNHENNSTTVNVTVSAAPIAFYAFKESAPLQLVVELHDIDPGAVLTPLRINDGLVTYITRIAGGEGTRIEIGLAQDADYEILRSDNKLTVTLTGEMTATAEPSSPKTQAWAQTEPSATPLQAEPGKPAAQETGTPASRDDMFVKTADSAPGSPCRVTSIDFKVLPNGKSRVIIATTAKAGYELSRTSRDILLLTLQRALLPEHLARHLDTSQFSTAALNAITPSQSGQDLVIAMRFRQVVPYHLTRDEGGLVLEFDSCAVRPERDISLTRRELQRTGEASPTDALIERAVNRVPEDMSAETEEMHSLESNVVKVTYPGTIRHFTGNRISLDFQNADVHNVLRLISEVSGLNVITSDEVKGKLTMRLNKIPWDQALDLILATCDLAMSRTGEVIRIASAKRFREEQKQAEDTNQAVLDARRKKELTVPLVTENIKVNYAKAEGMCEQAKGLLTSRGKVTFDERVNVVIVTDVQDVVKRARQLIDSLDWPTPQVMIEARIVEATTNFTREIGTRWGVDFQKTVSGTDGVFGIEGDSGVNGGFSAPDPATGEQALRTFPFIVNLPTTGPAGAINFQFARLANDLNIDVRLQALENQGKLRIVSSPRVLTLDNTEAYIQQGEDIPYLAQSVDGISTQFVQTKLCLTVTPHITPDGRIRMKIKAEKSEPSEREVKGTPGILRKEAQTELLVNSGETVVLGGILKDNTNRVQHRVPYLHQIPILGWLFKYDKKVDEKQELLIFITPKIMSVEQIHVDTAAHSGEPL